MVRKNAETSDKMSSLAARYWKISPAEIRRKISSPAGAEEVASDIRSMAASLLRQDETPGLLSRAKRWISG